MISLHGLEDAFTQVVRSAHSKPAGPRGYMQENMIHDTEHPELPEQRLWRAVIASTVAEWVHGPLSRKREAELFLFSNHKDYRTVCFSAGINPESLRDRLEKIRVCKSPEVIKAATRN
jgi:hypothetical protein